MVFSLPPPTSLPPPQTEDEQLTRCSRLESNKKEKHEDWGEENVGIKQLFFRPRLFFSDSAQQTTRTGTGPCHQRGHFHSQVDDVGADRDKLIVSRPVD